MNSMMYFFREGSWVCPTLLGVLIDFLVREVVVALAFLAATWKMHLEVRRIDALCGVSLILCPLRFPVNPLCILRWRCRRFRCCWRRSWSRRRRPLRSWRNSFCHALITPQTQRVWWCWCCPRYLARRRRHSVVFWMCPGCLIRRRRHSVVCPHRGPL